LSFFYKNVYAEVKAEMALALQKEDDDDCSCRIQLAEDCISHETLGDFVSCNTRKLFTALNVSQDFLELHPV